MPLVGSIRCLVSRVETHEILLRLWTCNCRSLLYYFLFFFANVNTITVTGLEGDKLVLHKRKPQIIWCFLKWFCFLLFSYIVVPNNHRRSERSAFCLWFVYVEVKYPTPVGSPHTAKSTPPLICSSSPQLHTAYISNTTRSPLFPACFLLKFGCQSAVASGNRHWWKDPWDKETQIRFQ